MALLVALVEESSLLMMLQLLGSESSTMALK
jgi:hypothetical protein